MDSKYQSSANAHFRINCWPLFFVKSICRDQASFNQPLNHLGVAMNRFYQVWATLLFISCFLISSANAFQAESIVENGNFADWKDGRPVGWEFDVDAKSGEGNPSKISNKNGLQLSGDVKTTGWHFAKQSLKLKPNQIYRFQFSAKASAVKQEAGQSFDNCWVGLFFKNAQGQKTGTQIWGLSHMDQEQGDWTFKLEPPVVSADVMVFLSKTGKLSVNNVSVTIPDPTDSFEILCSDMDRNYSYFEHKKIDWKALTEKYRDKANAAAKEPDKFVDVVTNMLAELKDQHTWVIHNGQQHQKFSTGWKPNFDFRVVEKSLDNVKRIGNFGLVGKTKDGFGYIRLVSLSGMDKRTLQKFARAIGTLFDTPGIIMDLRKNNGGAEPVAAAIAGFFADQEYVYAKSKFRSGPKHSDFTRVHSRKINPGRGEIYTKPIVCLIGPAAISSAEGMALMMKSLPHCTTMGKPTRGSSGNPAPVMLPNGMEVFYSRWVAMTPEENSIEGVGVAPDIEVEHENGSDNTFTKAIATLREKTK